MPPVIVYDLDDTLYPIQQFVWGGFDAVEEWVGARSALKNFSSQAKVLYNAGVRGNIFNQVLNANLEDWDPVWISSMLSVYRDHSPQLHFFKEARILLERYARKMPHALITDGCMQTQKNKVKALGLDQYMDLIIYTDELGENCGKPSPLAFQKVENHFKCSGKDCIYIGDNPLKDFIAPKRLGWRTLRVRKPGAEHANTECVEEYRADQEVVSLEEITFESVGY